MNSDEFKEPKLPMDVPALKNKRSYGRKGSLVKTLRKHRCQMVVKHLGKEFLLFLFCLNKLLKKI